MAGVVLTGAWQRLMRSLQGLSELDLVRVHRSIGEALYNVTMEAFQDGASPDGDAWPSLKASTRRQRRQRAPKPLMDTGRLRRSIEVLATAEQVEVGTNVVYGQIHQRGGRAGRNRRVRIPARPFLGIGEAGEEAIGILEQEIRDRVGL